MFLTNEISSNLSVTNDEHLVEKTFIILKLITINKYATKISNLLQSKNPINFKDNKIQIDIKRILHSLKSFPYVLQS